MEKNKKSKKETKSIAGLLLGLCWLIFILLVLVFVFLFKDKLRTILKNESDSTNENVTANETVITDEEYRTSYSYETNSNMDIVSLFNDYYQGLANCDSNLLKSLVTNPDVYNDMSVIEQKSKLITGYQNIICYILPGYTDDANLVYTVANLSISGIASSPLDINQYYVINTGSGYLIENGVLSDDIIAYIGSQNENSDIQKLYKDVKSNIEYCIQTDQSFAEFYNQIYSINAGEN